MPRLLYRSWSMGTATKKARSRVQMYEMRTGSWVPGILVARLADRKRTMCCRDANSNYSWGRQDAFCCNLRMQWSKE